LLIVLLVGAWILGAVVCAVVVGRSVRSAELRREPAVPVVPRDLPDRQPAEDLGYVQICLFDATVLREPSSVQRVLVPHG